MGRPTEKMVNYIDSIIERFKVNKDEVDQEVYEDFDKAQEFIEKYKDKFTLSEKQKNIVDKIDSDEIKELGKKDVLTKSEYEKVKDAIKTFFDNTKSFTDKQLEVIKKNIDKFSDEVKTIIDKSTEMTTEEYNKVKEELDNFFKNMKK